MMDKSVAIDSYIARIVLIIVYIINYTQLMLDVHAHHGDLGANGKTEKERRNAAPFITSTLFSMLVVCHR